MVPWKRFLYGGIGALMPVLVTVISLDIAGLLSEHEIFNASNIIGIFIRYVVLFFIGGFIAYLHQEECVPFKLFEIGVAAPALLTSLITANAVQKTTNKDYLKKTENILSVSPAYALGNSSDRTRRQPLILSGWIKDAVDGFTGNVYEKNAPYNLLEKDPNWVSTSDGQIPQGAVIGGQEASPGHEDLYVCRAGYNEGIHPGKVRLAFHGCNIGWGGIEHTIPKYQVLVGNFRWVFSSGGHIPQGAIPGGKEKQPGNEYLFICRARFNNGVHPGKIRPAFNGCNIGWGGMEYTVYEYEVLIQ